MIVKYEDLGYTITNTNINHTTKLNFGFIHKIMHICDLGAAGVADDEADRGDEVRQGQREPRDHRHRPGAAGARPGAVQQSGHSHHQHLEQRIGEVQTLIPNLIYSNSEQIFLTVIFTRDLNTFN